MGIATCGPIRFEGSPRQIPTSQTGAFCLSGQVFPMRALLNIVLFQVFMRFFMMARALPCQGVRSFVCRLEGMREYNRNARRFRFSSLRSPDGRL
tara:strand:+ start:518 stop:802 length:285 start_codon:yes stop_codon:yes gene_type:complete